MATESILEDIQKILPERKELREENALFRALLQQHNIVIPEDNKNNIDETEITQVVPKKLSLEDKMRFLDDGRLEIDNNLTEQEIKPFVIARKNFLFCASQDGAKALCMHLGFICTAKLHGHDPYHYYVKLLKNIPHCKSVEDYEKLLPWNMASKVSE